MTHLQVAWASFFMNIASPTSSHAADVDNSDVVIVSNVQAIIDLFGIEGVLNVPTYVSFMVLSSRRSTAGPLLIFLLFRKGTLQFPVVPVSGMAQ